MRDWAAMFLCVAAGLSPGTQAVAQSAPAASESTAQAESAAPPIPVADILARADDDERFAQGVLRRIDLPNPIERLSPQLDVIAKSVDGRLLDLKPDELRLLPVARLESLERHWKFDARRFDRWDEDMQQAMASYGTDAAELSRRRNEWETTLQRIGSEIPASMGERASAVIGELRQAEQALSGPLARQIELRRRANAVSERIQSGLRAVAEAIDYIDQRLLRIDAPPLWAARPTGDYDAFATMLAGLGIEARFAREYSAADTGNQRALRVVQLLVLPLLLWLTRRSREAVATDQSTEPAVRVLKRPISAWLLLAMMAVLAFESDAPLLVQQIAMLIALVPILRLLPPDSRRRLDLWPYAAAGLFLIEQIGYALVEARFVYRLFYLALTFLALALTAWLLWRSHRRAANGNGQIGRGIHAAAWASVVIFTISLACNVVGNVSLAETLTNGVIDSGYLALMIYAGVTVIITLLQLLLTRPGLTRFAHAHAPPLVSLLIRLLLLASAIGWVIYTMYNFRILRPIQAALESILTAEFSIGEISLSLGHVLVFAAAVFIAFWAARFVRLLLHDEVLTRMSLPRGVANSIASLTYYALLMIGFFVALSAAGFKVSQLAIVFGALGVGIGFGLQNVVNNFVSGLILMFERPIQPGDVIDIGTVSGTVREIGMRATTIRTFEGADVVVPNGSLLSENLTNWTLLDRNRRIEVKVGVAYGSDATQVIELLKTTAKETKGVASSPEPSVFFTGLGESSLDFSVRTWTQDFDAWVNIRSDLVTRIYAALGEAGIEIPFPQRDLHVRSIAPEVAEVARQGGTPAPNPR